MTLEAFEEASLATIPAGRFGTPEEFAKVAVFLMSDHADTSRGPWFNRWEDNQRDLGVYLESPRIC